MGGGHAVAKKAVGLGPATVASIAYLSLAIAAAVRIAGRTQLNASARGALVSVVALSAVAYLVGVVQYIAYRDRAGAVVPLVGLSLFGAALCLLVIAI